MAETNLESLSEPGPVLMIQCSIEFLNRLLMVDLANTLITKTIFEALLVELWLPVVPIRHAKSVTIRAPDFKRLDIITLQSHVLAGVNVNAWTADAVPAIQVLLPFLLMLLECIVAYVFRDEFRDFEWDLTHGSARRCMFDAAA